MKITRKTHIAYAAILALGVSSAVSPTHANNEKQIYKIAEGMADCSAIWRLNGDYLLKLTNDRKTQTAMHELSNGAIAASAWLLFKNSLTSEMSMAYQYAEERMNVQINKIDAYVAVADKAGDNKEVKKRVLEVMEKSQDCLSNYHEKQIELVTELRREMYKLAGEKR